MTELLDKISSYNLFNYLLPGILFAVIASKFTHYSFLGYEIVVALFLYYFIGLVVSRFGSLVIEPLLRWTGFVKYVEDYGTFVDASKTDPKVELLSEVNNTYRTLISLFVLLLLLKLYEKAAAHWPLLERFHLLVLVVILGATFVFAYKKQTEYVKKRIKANEHRQIV
jgi:hypothetical protein